MRQKYPNLAAMPYYKTKVTAVRSRSEIERLLSKYGIEDLMWGKSGGKEAIQFLIDTISQGAHIKKMVRIDIPNLKARYAGKLVDVPRAQVLRFIYHNLKSILEASKYNIFRLEHLLMSYILTQLPGTTKLVQLKDLLEEHPLMLSGVK